MELDNKAVNVLRFEILKCACEDFVYCKQALYQIELGVYRGNSLRYYRPGALSKGRIQWDLDEVIDFFYSDWFTYLYSPIDPQKIIDYMDYKVDKWKREFYTLLYEEIV